MADSSNDSSKVWTVFSLVAALGAAALAKKGLNTSWRAATGKNPPANPADPDVDLWEAVAWAAVSGTFIALARMLATRRAANYYAQVHRPPAAASCRRTARTPTRPTPRPPDPPSATRTKGRHPVGWRPFVVAWSARALRRSPADQLLLVGQLRCGGGPGSSSCR